MSVLCVSAPQLTVSVSEGSSDFSHPTQFNVRYDGKTDFNGADKSGDLTRPRRHLIKKKNPAVIPAASRVRCRVASLAQRPSSAFDSEIGWGRGMGGLAASSVIPLTPASSASAESRPDRTNSVKFVRTSLSIAAPRSTEGFFFFWKPASGPGCFFFKTPF